MKGAWHRLPDAPLASPVPRRIVHGCGLPDPELGVNLVLRLTQLYVHGAVPRTSAPAWHGASPVTRRIVHGCGLPDPELGVNRVLRPTQLHVHGAVHLASAPVWHEDF